MEHTGSEQDFLKFLDAIEARGEAVKFRGRYTSDAPEDQCYHWSDAEPEQKWGHYDDPTYNLEDFTQLLWNVAQDAENQYGH
jgi:hypothetical protein